MTQKTVAIQMDAPESINPATDTTMLLAIEATRRGYNVVHYHPSSLTFKNGELTALARPIVFKAGEKDFFTAKDWFTQNLHEADVVLMRQDPPFDMAYITATYLLERLAPDTLVINNPAAVRNAPEKLFMFDFAQFVPPTLITRDKTAIEAFLAEHQKIVLKPLYGYAGQSVFSVAIGDTNFHSLLEVLLGNSNEPIIVQRFLPEIATMDKRIIVIDGHVSVVMGRIPAQGDIRANMRVGGTGAKIEPSARDLLIGETIGKELIKRGVVLAGLDVIGEYLTEINVTCPTGLVKSNALYGITQERIVWDAIERRIA